MQFASLGSGSSGNATVIRGGKTTLLLDCGFSLRKLEERLNARGLTSFDLDALLVTHEHGDHSKGVGVTARNLQIPVYASSGTAESVVRRDNANPNLQQLVREIQSDRPFRIGDINVFPIDVPHDASQPTQFVFRYSNVSIGVLTDCGSITRSIVNHYSGLDGLLLETNHDLEMLREGPYPDQLKDRVGSDYGHLNNRQSREFADEVVKDNMQHLVLGHISQQNNDVEVIQEEFVDLEDVVPITYATQDSGTEWITVKNN